MCLSSISKYSQSLQSIHGFNILKIQSCAIEGIVMTFKTILLSVLVSVIAEGPEFFRTNIDEFENCPLTFDRPLPQWLKGTLVCIVIVSYL